jgi:hypothetical protein
MIHIIFAAVMTITLLWLIKSSSMITETQDEKTYSIQLGLGGFALVLASIVLIIVNIVLAF